MTSFFVHGSILSKSSPRVPEPPAPVDEEAQIRRELRAAKKRMKKHLKLQQWLKAKEERELEALRAEQDMLEAKERERAEAERKRRKRAKAQKKKVDRFRKGIRDEALQAVNQ